MHRGKIVESGPALEILQDPKHPYTQRLVAAAPSLASTPHPVGGHVAFGRRARRRRRGGVRPRPSPPRSRRDIDDEGRAGHRVPRRDEGLQDPHRQLHARPTSRRSTRSRSRVPKGSTMALVGESGSGKSTAAKLLLGLERLTSGSIFVNGADVSKLNRKRVPRAPPADAAGVPGPVRLARPAAQHRQHDLRAPPHPQGRRRRVAQGARARGARAGRAPHGARDPVPERALGRSAAARRHRPRARAQARHRRPRRGGLGARRAGAGAGAQPARRAAVRARAHLPVHHPRPRGGPRHRRPRLRHGEGQDRRAVDGRRGVREPARGRTRASCSTRSPGAKIQLAQSQSAR